MSCVFFDMDGTLVNGDTNDLFFKYLLNIKLIDKKFLEPMVEFNRRYYEGTLDIKDFIIYAMQPLVGKTMDEINSIIAPCLNDIILKKIRPGALKAIAYHKQKNDTLVIVSATVDYMIENVAKHLGIDHVIAAPTLKVDGKLSGKLNGVVPYQDGKRIRILEFIKQHNLNLDNATAYGDSVNDIEMFKLCSYRYAIHPTIELQQHPYFKELTTLNWD